MTRANLGNHNRMSKQRKHRSYKVEGNYPLWTANDTLSATAQSPDGALESTWQTLDRCSSKSHCITHVARSDLHINPARQQGTQNTYQECSMEAGSNLQLTWKPLSLP